MSAMTRVAAALRVAEPFAVHSFHHTGAAHGGPGRCRWPLSLLTIACALAINTAHGQAAEEAASPFALDTTTITATRTANSSFELPASVSTVERQQLDEVQANTLSTALRTLPNVNYGGGPRAAAQSPAIRGLQGPRIILTVDGARRNNDGGVNTPLLIDPDLIRQIDVVRGPMSAAYGSGGLGGVMAIETLNADDMLDPGQSSGGRIKAGYRSANRESSSNLTLAARGERADILASGTYRDYGTIHTGASGSDAQYPNDGHLQSGLLKSRFSPNELNHFELGYQRFADQMVGPTNPGGNLMFPFSQKLQREQEQYNASWAFEDAEQRLLDGKLALYQTRFTLDGDSRSVPRQPTTATQTKTQGASLQNTSRIEAGNAGAHRLTYGVDGYRDSNENASDGQSNSVLPNGHMRALGGFVQDELAFLDDWTLIAALRHDDYRLTSPGQEDSLHSRLSPKVALKYQPWAFLGVFVSYGEAFRAPTMTEMFGNLNTRRALFNFRPNPGLKPETSKTREVGATLAFDDLLAGGDSLRAKVTYFREDVDDLIDQQVVGRYARQAPFAGTGMIFQRVNVAQAERHGGEAQLSYQWQRLSVGAGYSRLRSRNADTGAQLYAPPDKLVLGGQYRLDEHWSLNYQGQYVWAQDYDATELRRRQGYVIHDIGGAFEYRQYRADLGVSNLFDKAYSTYQQSLANTFTYEEGRSVNLTLSARF